MLLRASSEELGGTIDVGAALAGSDDQGVRHGGTLAAYAKAAHDRGEELSSATEQARRDLGDAGWVEAAMTVASFNGLVRTADASGIPLEDGVVSATADDRARLGLAELRGAANSDLSVAAGADPHPARFA